MVGKSMEEREGEEEKGKDGKHWEYNG